jgi:hypothetical protein
MGLDQIARETLTKHYFDLAEKIFLLTDCLLAACISGNAKASFIYSIRKPFTCCSIQQEWVITVFSKSIQSLLMTRREGLHVKKFYSNSNATDLPFQLMKWNLLKIFTSALQQVQ